jgi:hypothetical protein
VLYSVDSYEVENVLASKTLFLIGRKICSFWVIFIGLAVENVCNNSLNSTSVTRITFVLVELKMCPVEEQPWSHNLV